MGLFESKFGDHTTNLPATVRYANNVNGSLVFKESLQYRYDCMGNIVEVLENGRSLYKYEYDALGRLTREDNQAFKTTKQYVYDNNGNIIAKYQYPITTTPTNELQWLTAEKSTQYGYATNSDRLMTYGAETFAYDTIGNPTTYRGKTATWKNGRQLTEYEIKDKDINKNITFAYDARGKRTSKKEGEDSITFTYDSSGKLLKQSNGLEFLYDHTGIFAVKQGDSTYYYRKNLQNDIISLLDKDGTVVVKYRYDAWGVCKVLDANGNEITNANDIGNLNPFRYRSYYYDTETSLYYLQSRYYDPEVGRFITIDDISYLDPDSINGLNLYAYCLNNPLLYSDYSGYAPWWSWALSGLQLIGGIVLCFVPGAQGIGIGLVIGGTLGLIANAASPAIAQAIGGASSVANGWSAFSTGMSILGLGIPGLIGGIALMLVGGATMVFGANEIVMAATGTNYIQQWTGISDSAYDWTYFVLNLASSIGQIFGRTYYQDRTKEIIYDSRNGNEKQYRYYDTKGKRLYDKDLAHQNYGNPKMKFPHYHAWLNESMRLGEKHTGYLIMILELFRRLIQR